MIEIILTALLSFVMGALVMFVFQKGEKKNPDTKCDITINPRVEECQETYPPFRSFSSEIREKEFTEICDEDEQHEYHNTLKSAPLRPDCDASSSRTRSISFDSKDLSSCNTAVLPVGNPTLRLSPVLHPKISSDLEMVKLLDEVEDSPRDNLQVPTRTVQAKKKNEEVKNLEISPLDNEHAMKSNFWRPMIMSNLGEKISFCPQELSYRFSQQKKKINFDGCWVCGDGEPFLVDNRIIDHLDGTVDCILFDFSLNDFVVDRERSITNQRKEDKIVWTRDNATREQLIWRRYTILDAMRKELHSQRIYLPPLCYSLVKHFVGPKVWVPVKRSFQRKVKRSLFSDERNHEVEKGLREFGLKTISDYQTMKDRILNMEQFSTSELLQLLSIVPTDYECEVISEKVSTLKQCKCKTDRWFRIISAIPNLERRLSVWLFTLQFPKKLLECQDTVKVLDRSYQSISENKSLKLMFALILSVCNYMNEGTAWGGIYGFKLDTLKKLSQCRGNQESLLFYIVLIAHQKHPGSLRFVHELSILSNASTLCEGFGEVECIVGGMGDNIRRITNELDSGLYDESFAEFIEVFLLENSEKYALLASTFESTVESFKKFGRDLGESNMKLRTRDFSYIEELDDFRQEVQKAMAKISETKEIQERKMEIAKKWKVTGTRKRHGSINSQSSEDSEIEFIRVKQRLDRKRRRRETKQLQEQYLSEIIGTSLANEEIKLSQIPFTFNDEEDHLFNFEEHH